MAEPPAIIALQETNTQVKLPGYRPFQQPHSENKYATAILVQRNMACTSAHFDSVEIPHTFATLYPQSRKHSPIHILNVYSSPREHKHRFGYLLALAKREAARDPLLVLGDFNAPHPAWGYHSDSIKGRDLWTQIQTQHFTLLTDPIFPSRIGNSVTRDTCPDLTFITSYQGQAQWTNTDHTLGSDHCILATLLQFQTPRPKCRQATLVHWDRFRTLRESTNANPITDVQQWTQQVVNDVQTTTEFLPENITSPTVDSHLAMLWNSFSQKESAWRQQKHNRTLRLQLEALRAEVEDYTLTLQRNQWDDICDRMKGSLGMRSTWQLLRHLLDPTTSKVEQRQRMTPLLHKYPGSDEDLLKEAQTKYLPEFPTQPLPDYAGSANPDLDRNFTLSEVRAAILKLRTSSTPGLDQITNKAIRNLDTPSLEALTAYFNECWQSGTLPPTWKHAKVVLIPKPGKPLALENLRPISLTSCLGKLLEHVVHTRLTRYLEESGQLPPTMIGFRAHLSTQDVMLQLHHDVVTPHTHHDTQAILALDLTKAFDQVSHASILQGLASTNPGERTYNYIRDFLSSRTATLQIGDLTSPEITIGGRGTPQGAVLSPLLFNLALIKLPPALTAIPGLHHSIYADDVTLWATKGSDAELEDSLNQGAHAVCSIAAQAGLTCTPSKSALLLLPPPVRRRNVPSTPTNIEVRVNGDVVPTVNSIRVLGLTIQHNRKNSEFITKFSSQVQQTIRLISRITMRRKGLQESELIRLLHAFVLSRLTYALPYLHLTPTEMNKIDTLIRQAYKAALKLPHNTPTRRLLDLGLHNTAAELIEVHRTSQYERLSRSPPGRLILSRLNLNPPTEWTPKRPLPTEIHSRLAVAPLPRNMHPIFHEGRRRSRATAHHKIYTDKPDVLYVDAAEYRHRPAFAIAAVTSEGQITAGATIFTTSPEQAEEAAIALALATTPRPRTIISDSKAAILNYAKGYVSTPAQAILRTLKAQPLESAVSLVWTPAHSGLCGNELAHSTARGFTTRAEGAQLRTAEIRSARDSLVTFHDITSHFRLTRRIYPPAAPVLSREESIMWRQLQTHSFPCPLILSHIYPPLYTPNCSFCEQRATLSHILW